MQAKLAKVNTDSTTGLDWHMGNERGYETCVRRRGSCFPFESQQIFRAELCKGCHPSHPAPLKHYRSIEASKYRSNVYREPFSSLMSVVSLAHRFTRPFQEYQRVHDGIVRLLHHEGPFTLCVAGTGECSFPPCRPMPLKGGVRSQSSIETFPNTGEIHSTLVDKQGSYSHTGSIILLFTACQSQCICAVTAASSI